MRKIYVLIGLFVAYLDTSGQGVKIANPEDHGMSSAKLEALSGVLQNAVESKKIGSAVGLIARNGQILFHRSYGMLGENIPMPVDAICRMASIGKTITAAAVMKLIERGELALEDPVSKYLPEYNDVKVGITNYQGELQLVDPNTKMSVHQLLTHQSGLASRGNKFWGVWDSAKDGREFAALISELPLEFHPGERFHYGQMGSSYEVLAALVTEITNKSFRDFLREEILDPLKMEDTYFYVPEEKKHRLSAVYVIDKNGNLAKFRKAGEEEPETNFFAGGGALRSTVKDYFSFIQCLLDDGKFEGKQILSPQSVAQMIRNQVAGGAWNQDTGWGFGVAIQLNETNGSGSKGTFGWNGGTGTIYQADPREKLISILFIPSQPRTPHIRELRNEFVESAYQAISEYKR